MTQAKHGDTVTIHYTGKTQEGQVFETTTQGNPIQITIGSGDFWPVIEDALVGMDIGETKTVEITEEESIPYHDDLIFKVSRDKLPKDIPLEEGIVLQVAQKDGQQMSVTVDKIEEDTVILNANHPLAGSELTFVVEMIAIS
ncbi:MAG: FKBP-type peptidyl-prolyl cis-trans isomerase [Waddliaceae bacterium]